MGRVSGQLFKIPLPDYFYYWQWKDYTIARPAHSPILCSFYVCVCEFQVEQEYLEPHSQPRVTGVKVQHMWSQSLYIMCQLLQGNFINVGEVDPLNRRLCKTTKPDTLVQGELCVWGCGGVWVWVGVGMRSCNCVGC